MSKAIATQEEQHPVTRIGAVIAANKDKIFQAVPRNVTPDRLAQVFLGTLRQNPTLLQCSQESLLHALTQASGLGLEIDGVLGHAYLVPFKSEATLIPGYKGLIDLCRRSGGVSTVSAQSVFSGDKFAYQLGTNPTITHVPDDTLDRVDPDTITHVYAVVRLRDGGVQFSVWPKAKIEAHKKRYSKNWQKRDSAWQTAWESMAKKTVLRALIQSGEVPVSAEVKRLAGQEVELEVAHARSEIVAPDRITTSTLDDIDGEVADQTKPPSNKPDDNPPPDVPEVLTEYATAIHEAKTPEEVRAATDQLNDLSSHDDYEAGMALADWKLARLGKAQL